MINDRERLPEHLKTKICSTDDVLNKKVRKILNEKGLNTVCDNARCPNKAQCYSCGSATFLIMGTICTRNCKFCNIKTDSPLPLDENEPVKIAQAVNELDLKYCVITSVTRDDLPDFGSNHFARTICEIRKINPDIKIEVLTPDFCGNTIALDVIIDAKPNVFNHNIETVKNQYKKAREMANYEQSLNVLDYVEKNSDIITKTGIMVGLGETFDELEELFVDIKKADCKILTIGQYIQPSKNHLRVEKYYSQDEFKILYDSAKKIGIKEVVSTPLARSSFMAHESFDAALRQE